MQAALVLVSFGLGSHCEEILVPNDIPPCRKKRDKGGATAVKLSDERLGQPPKKREPSRWNLPLHQSTRRSRNLRTGAGRRSRKCAQSSTRQTRRSLKSGSGPRRHRRGFLS